MKFEISVKAQHDLEEIWLYTFQNWSIEQADRYLNLIFDEIHYLSENPLAGRDYSELRKKYRCSKVKSHLIFYRTTESSVIEVIRILHERMDLEEQL
jgi:toxin ParE1/3/4